MIIAILGIYRVSGNKFLQALDITQDKQPPKYAGPVEKIVIANQREHSIFNYIAREQGYFKEHGIDAEIREYESGASASADLLASKVDGAFVGEFVAVSRTFTNPELRIVAQMSQQQYVRLVARRDSGIESPADLGGKKNRCNQRNRERDFREQVFDIQ